MAVFSFVVLPLKSVIVRDNDLHNGSLAGVARTSNYALVPTVVIATLLREDGSNAVVIAGDNTKVSLVRHCSGPIISTTQR